jgi:hypothetical protein
MSIFLATHPDSVFTDQNLTSCSLVKKHGEFLLVLLS